MTKAVISFELSNFVQENPSSCQSHIQFVDYFYTVATLSPLTYVCFINFTDTCYFTPKMYHEGIKWSYCELNLARSDGRSQLTFSQLLTNFWVQKFSTFCHLLLGNLTSSYLSFLPDEAHVVSSLTSTSFKVRSINVQLLQCIPRKWRQREKNYHCAHCTKICQRRQQARGTNIR